jgi:hypothetical protein
MESITIHPKSKEQIKVFEQMAKALKIPFEKIETPDDSLYGEGFKKSVLEAQEAYDKGDYSEFAKINRQELWK